MVRVSDGKSRPEPARLRLSMETLAVQKEMTVKETRPAMHARVIFSIIFFIIIAMLFRIICTISIAMYVPLRLIKIYNITTSIEMLNKINKIFYKEYSKKYVFNPVRIRT